MKINACGVASSCRFYKYNKYMFVSWTSELEEYYMDNFTQLSCNSADVRLSDSKTMKLMLNIINTTGLGLERLD